MLHRGHEPCPYQNTEGSKCVMRHNKLIYTLNFAQIGLKDFAKAAGVGVNDGFATTADAYRAHLAEGQLEYELRSLVSDFDHEDVEELKRRGHAARVAVLDMPLPKELRDAIIRAYEQLCQRLGREPELAVRASVIADDLPEASFAGTTETFLNVRGREALLRAVRQCFASAFTDRAISYRARLGCDHLKVAISVSVQPMVRSDKASSGVVNEALIALEHDAIRGAGVILRGNA